MWVGPIAGLRALVHVRKPNDVSHATRRLAGTPCTHTRGRARATMPGRPQKRPLKIPRAGRNVRFGVEARGAHTAGALAPPPWKWPRGRSEPMPLGQVSPGAAHGACAKRGDPARAHDQAGGRAGASRASVAQYVSSASWSGPPLTASRGEQATLWRPGRLALPQVIQRPYCLHTQLLGICTGRVGRDLDRAWRRQDESRLRFPQRSRSA